MYILNSSCFTFYLFPFTSLFQTRVLRNDFAKYNLTSDSESDEFGEIDRVLLSDCRILAMCILATCFKVCPSLI